MKNISSFFDDIIDDFITRNYFINVNENIFRFVEIDDAQKKIVDRFQILFFRECFCDAIHMNVFVYKIYLIYLFFNVSQLTRIKMFFIFLKF